MAEMVAELVIERISFDYGVEFAAGDGSVVRVEGEGSVVSHGQPPVWFDAESAGPVASVLLGFLHQGAKVLLDGSTLQLSADDVGLVLRVAPSNEYEAWSTAMADGSRIVCMDDGTVSRWAAS